MDTLLPAGFILGILSLSWLLFQGACLYLLVRFNPELSSVRLNATLSPPANRRTARH